jgi:xanthine dehydrogenase accessory factor
MDFWKQILAKLAAKQKVYLLSVIESTGSSPGRQGFKMGVAQDGIIFGSIGGGVMEHTLVTEAKTLIKQKESPAILFKKQVHRKKAQAGSGMICSGEQNVVFHLLDVQHEAMIRSIIHVLETSQKVTLTLSNDLFAVSDDKMTNKFYCKIKKSTDWLYKEQIGFKDTLYIIGGGHVGLACSKLFNILGFNVVLFDNRQDLNTFELNTFAHQKQIIDYAKVMNYIPEGNDSYIAIMTNKYTDDKLALAKLVRNKYKFLGVLGSKAKLKTMYQVLKKEGFSEAELAKVHAPIGLPIASQTPDEIAVSIAAQIIKLRNSGNC